MTRDGRAYGLRPGEHLCIGAVTSFRSQRVRNVRHGMSAGLQFSEAHDPITWGYRDRAEGQWSERRVLHPGVSE